MWHVDQTATALTLAVHLAGDYNGNGVVGAEDYTLWRDTLGQMGVGLAADGNGSGAIDAGDFDVWKANFGEVAAGSGAVSAVAVPEPTSLVAALSLLLLSVAGSWLRGPAR